DFFHTDNSFRGGDVRERWSFDNVADRINTGNVGAIEVVNNNLSFLNLHTGLLQTNAFQVGSDTHRRQHHICFNLNLSFRCLNGGNTGFSFCVDRGYFRVDMNLHALFAESFIQGFRHFLVFDRNNPRQEFDESNFGTKRLIEVGKLDTNSSRTHDEHFARQFVEHHSLAVSYDLLPVDLEVRQFARPSSRGKDHVLRFNFCLLALIIGNFNLAAFPDFSEARDLINLVLLEEELHALAVAVGNGTASFHQGGKVRFYVLGTDTVVGRMF